MSHLSFRKLTCFVFLIQATAGAIYWYHLSASCRLDFSGPASLAVGTVLPKSPELFDVESALEKVRAAVSRPPDEQNYEEKIWSALHPLSAVQVEEVISTALRQTVETQPKRLLPILFGHLAALSPDLALDLAGKLPPETTDETLALLLDYWASRHLPTARKWYEAHLAGRAESYPKVAKTVGEWSKLTNAVPEPLRPYRDILTDYQAARKLRGPNLWLGGAREILEYFRRTRDWAGGLAISGSDASLRREIHRIWSKDDPAGWLDWMRDNPGEGVEQNGYGQVIRIKRDSMIGECISRQRPSNSLTGPVFDVGLLLNKGIDAALAGNSSLLAKNETHAPDIMFLLWEFENWIKEEPHQASAWVKRNQQEPWAQPLITKLVLTVVKDDPTAAFEWAGKIRDDAQRAEISNKAYGIWRALDPTTADAWAADHLQSLTAPSK